MGRKNWHLFEISLNTNLDKLLNSINLFSRYEFHRMSKRHVWFLNSMYMNEMFRWAGEEKTLRVSNTFSMVRLAGTVMC